MRKPSTTAMVIVAVAAITIVWGPACAGTADISPEQTGSGAPSYSPAPGTYSTSQLVSLSSPTPGAEILFTTDGTEPSPSSTIYAEPFAVASTTVVKAFARAQGYADSAVVTATYVISDSDSTPAPPSAAASPAFTPTAGTYATAQLISLTSSTYGADIFYTLDGSDPSGAWSAYSAPFPVSSTTTIKAFARAQGYADSPVTAATYVISASGPTAPPPLAGSPVFDPAAGTYASAQLISLSSTTSGAQIFYTVDGSMPSASSSAYSTPLLVSSTTTVKAFARAPGHADSPIASATYTIAPGEPIEPDYAALLSSMASKAWFFGHRSVGSNIMDGLGRLLAAYPGSGLTRTYLINGSPRAGQFADAQVGANQNPYSKISSDHEVTQAPSFETHIRSGGAGTADFALMKLCYVDIADSANMDTRAEVDALFALYQQTLAELEADHPSIRFLHVTEPLLAASMPGAVQTNTLREYFNDKLRAAYGDRVFDLADWESRDRSGNLILSSGVRVLYPEWTSDGGHLSTAGGDYVARKMVEFLAGHVTTLR